MYSTRQSQLQVPIQVPKTQGLKFAADQDLHTLSLNQCEFVD